MEEEPTPHVRRAYRTLLGNEYERGFWHHMQLSAAAQTFATDFGSAMEWGRKSVEQSVATMAPGTFQPILITDQGSAFLHPDDFYSTGITSKIAEFVRAVGATFAVVCYGSSGGEKKHEPFIIAGTNGWTTRHMRLVATYKRFGSPHVELHEDKEMPPWGDSFLGDVAFALRANQEG